MNSMRELVLLKVVPYNQLVERLADLEHRQWVCWSKHIAKTEKRLTAKRRARWKTLWKPYQKLSVLDQNADRQWAEIVIEELVKLGVMVRR
jgi:hypothetical protein